MSALGADPGREAVPSAPTVSPFIILEAEQALRAFDCSTRWGPALSLTSFDRLVRLRMHPGAPTGWEWVDEDWGPHHHWADFVLRHTRRYDP
jgi:hypothetical protein